MAETTTSETTTSETTGTVTATVTIGGWVSDGASAPSATDTVDTAGHGGEANQLWDRLVGQPRAVELLRRAARRPSHAYLLAGPPGSGLDEAARCLAAALLCPDGGCGRCSTCTRTLRGRHPDGIEIEPEGTSILKEQAAEIVEAAVRSPYEAARKVIVIFEADRMNETAENKLLKTFEEPPATTHFVLVTSAPDDLLPTVLSRCQRIDLGALTDDVIAESLQREGVPGERARAVARLAGGRLDRARRLAGVKTDPDGRPIPDLQRLRAVFVDVARRLDGTGGAAALGAAGLTTVVQEAFAETVEAHKSERDLAASEMAEHHYDPVAVAAASKRLKQRHDRLEKRARNDALMEGLTALETVYRDALMGRLGAADPLDGERPPLLLTPTAALKALDQCARARAVLVEHSAVNEGLLLEHLLLHLTGS